MGRDGGDALLLARNVGMDNDTPLSDGRAFALAKSTMRTAAICGLIAAGFAWYNGLRWYWILLIAFGVYFLSAMIEGIGLALLAKRRQKAAIRERRFAKLSSESWQNVLREFKRLQEEEKK